MSEHQGFLTTYSSQSWAIVVSRFNQRVTDRLLEGAVDTLIRHGVPADNIDVFWVPCAFEIPNLVNRLVNQKYAAIITLGAIVRGETPHFDFIASAATSAIADLARHSPMPIIFGVLTTDTMAQAEDRADGKSGNKGAEAALSAIEMANLYHRLQKD
ncbi:MAG: 6,7-dimethyl-8-ribityllumazine synthase [Sulfobacillus thermosulfidooxidans]|nr:MAG: 6,7-dimethyl-8-ribityllumazine synthase [Sulfobacillus thermosulfidooxidans]